MKKVCLIVGIILLFTLVFNRIGHAEDQILVRKLSKAGQKYIPREIIVKFKPGVSEDAIANLNSRHGAATFYRSRHFDFRRLRISRRRKTVSEMLELYRRNPHVEYAEPNYIAHAFWKPNDEYYQYQWHMNNAEYGGIHMEEAWDIESGNNGIRVAVIDTGVAYEDYTEPGRWWRRKTYYRAPDLGETAFVPGYDFVDDDSHPNDDNGHGTHISGTIAQTTNNGIGVAGVAFNCLIMPVKVLDTNGSGTYADVAEGIRFAVDNGAHIINMSLGGPYYSVTLRDAVAYAYSKGVTIVCAAGNDGSSNAVSYPAAYDDYCIAVGATRYDETVTYYSNGGSSLDLVAPGGDLNVDQNGDGYVDGILQQTFGSKTNDWGYWFYEGTSCAAPHVSGVAALLIAEGVATTPDEVREFLQSSAKDKGPSGWDPDYGWGILDAAAALAYTPGPVNSNPSVNITSPLEGTIVTDQITIEATASDDVGVLRVDFYIDGTYLGTDDSSPYSISWNSNTVADGTHYIGVTAIDTAEQTGVGTVSVLVDNVNELPVADAGQDQTVTVGQTVNFDGSGSYDSDGNIISYNWDFGDDSSAAGVNVTHAYSSVGTYTVTLAVTDNGGMTDTHTAIVTVTEEPNEIEVFSDSFEVNEWNGKWIEDSQNDWFRSKQRAVDGGYSAEVDGRALNAQLTSIPIYLEGRTNATINFSWYIERSLDSGEYLAFDVSTDGAANWVEKARLSGNVDPENTWHNVSIDLTNINNLSIRFRGKISISLEDADVDMVQVVAR